MLSIGAVAHAAEVTPRVVRYYEQQGLLTSERTSGGQRRYTDAAIERVQFIQQLIQTGLTTEVIRSLLSCVNTRVATPDTVRQLTAQRDHIAERAANLRRMQDRLDGLIVSAQKSMSV